ncbi:MAG: type II toxin-antitoxin system RelE/ParE family toxin [Chitinophagaceae bacterium]|nr:type II toxin-antitoxin system RelE/ParE family toxin [Chitinophagaceae bacterium]
MKKSNLYEVKLEERVLDDFEDAFLYYESVSPALADNFTRMFLLAIEKLSATPHNYFNITKKLKRITLGKFPYLLVYTIIKDSVIVAGLFHRASKPASWRKK